MPRNGILNLIISILTYLFIGFLAIAFIVTVFPLLAVVIAIGIVAALIFYIIHYFQFRQVRRKDMDEFGNRKTTATILEIKDADGSVGSPTAADNQTNSKDKI
jgi:hypothetical protein